MSDIEDYLAELRAHLADLAPKRVDEIVAEARTHLESRAAQLRAGGMCEDEASAEAVRSFGGPAELAARLAVANSRHSSSGVFRVLASLAIVWGTIFAAIVGSHTWERLLPPSVPWLVVLALLVAPAAGVAGTVVGRRPWWIAGLAPAGLYFVLVLATVWDRLLTGRWEDGWQALIFLSVTLLLGAWSFVGSRVNITERLKHPARAAAGVYFLGIAAVAVTGLQDAVGVLAFVAVVQAATGVLALGALWDRCRWRSWVLWVGGLLLAASVIFMIVLGTYGALLAGAGWAIPRWTAVVLGQTVTWIALSMLYRSSRAREQTIKESPDGT